MSIFEACRIFINRGKGAKDRYILFPASFRLVLKSHLKATPRNRYLFETIGEKAGLSQPVHPHCFAIRCLPT